MGYERLCGHLGRQRRPIPLNPPNSIFITNVLPIFAIRQKQPLAEPVALELTARKKVLVLCYYQ